MEEPTPEEQQPDYGQNNYVPLILSTIALFLIAVTTVSRYGNLRTQPWYVSTVCIIGWCFPFWIVLLLPLDFSSTLYDHCDGECKRPFTHVSQDFLYVAWRTLYWCSFSLTWILIPFLQSYVNTGDFTIAKRVKSAIRVNLQFYSIYIVVGIVGLLYLIFASGYTTKEKIQGFVMAMANSWGLFLVIMFMGYGLVAVPRRLWFTGDVKRHLRQLYAKAPRTKEECIDSELEFNELAKTMNVISQRPLRNDPYLRLRVDQMIKRFPFVLHPDYSDRDNIVSVPRNITEEYLVKLSKDMIIASRMKDRKMALWKNLLNEAFYLQDIISNRDNSDHRFHSTVRPLKESTQWNDIKACIEWWWVLKIEPVLHRGLALLYACISICILWSELVFNVRNPVLSIVALGLKACGFNYAAMEVTAFLTITYMCMCVYTSLFKVRFFNLYLLIPNHHTDENSLLWFTGYLCKMMAPLCYNYINLAGNTSTSADTVFNKFMGHADLVPFLGTTFIDWFPVVILIPALSILLNFQGRCFGLCGVKDPYDNADGDPEAGPEGSIASEIAEGKALINEERRLLERSINPDRNDQRGLFNRARSALGQYTSKYGQPASPTSIHSSRSLHAYPSQNRPSALASNLRQERDRRIDEILSGRKTPTQPAFNSNASSDSEQEPGSTGAAGLQSFGDAVKSRISDIFQKKKPASTSSAAAATGVMSPPATKSEDVEPPERHQTIRSGRVFGRPTSPSGSNDFVRSRSPSPNNRFTLAGNRANRTSRPLSPFARFNEEEEDVLTRNVFADL